MDPFLGQWMERDTPSLNPDLANGLATKHLPYSQYWVDQIFRSIAEDFPPGLEYLGCRRCSATEEYNEITRKKSTGRRTYDVARSDVFMVKLLTRYQGKDLPPRMMNLPFVKDAGFIHINGSSFIISPVLSDRVISIGVSNIFIRLIRDKITIERTRHHFIQDGKRETINVTWSALHHKNEKMKKLPKTVRAETSLMHYLLCKYGFAETFMRFGKCVPVLGHAEINNNAYPAEEWVICQSTQIQPKGYAKLNIFPTEIRIAVRRKEYTPMVKIMIGAFFYILDHFPTLAKAEYIGKTNECRMWMVLLGHIIFSGVVNAGKLYDDIEAHMRSLDEYVDIIMRDKLADIGVHVQDLYQLLAYVMENFNDLLLDNADKVASMWNKELSVVPYVLFNIQSAIIRFHFKLKAAASKENKELTAKEIQDIMNATLKPGLIFNIKKPDHGEVTTISSPNDNKAFKVTSILVPQESSSKSNKRERGGLSNPAKRLDASVAEVGSYVNIPKNDPFGRTRLNLCLNISPEGLVLRDPGKAELLDAVQYQLRNKIS